MATLSIPLISPGPVTPVTVASGVDLAAADVGEIKNSNSRRIFLTATGATTMTVARAEHPDLTLTFTMQSSMVFDPHECDGDVVSITNVGPANVRASGI